MSAAFCIQTYDVLFSRCDSACSIPSRSSSPPSCRIIHIRVPTNPPAFPAGNAGPHIIETVCVFQFRPVTAVSVSKLCFLRGTRIFFPRKIAVEAFPTVYEPSESTLGPAEKIAVEAPRRSNNPRTGTSNDGLQTLGPAPSDRPSPGSYPNRRVNDDCYFGACRCWTGVTPCLTHLPRAGLERRRQQLLYWRHPK